MSRRSVGTMLVVAVLLPVLAGCGAAGGSGGEDDAGENAFRIVSGSENETLEPIIQRFAEEEGVEIALDYRGSVDIMLALEGGAADYDAVWPANSMWIALGDTQRVVTAEQSIMRSPVVLGVKRSKAEQLGWVGSEVRVADILAAAEAGDLTYTMTSASQSNSGASAYFGYLYAFAGNPEVLTSENLQDPAVREQVERILGTVDRSSGSSGWLKDLFLQRYDDFDAMVNYESVVIEANRELVESEREPLYAVYPVDGLAIADSPLGYVNKGEAEKEALFGRLQGYLLSDEVQQEILGLGRRVAKVGLEPENVDEATFNPEWGIDVSRVITPIRFPAAEVIREALDLYQTTFRKPSLTVFCLDFSGSMEGQPAEDLKRAMATLLDPEQARSYLLQASPDDVTVVIPFDEAPMDEWRVMGNDPAALADLQRRIEATSVDGGTDIYEPVAQAFAAMEEIGIGDRFPAVILMTDGQSNEGSFAQLRQYRGAVGLDQVPVHAITFGDASEEQLTEITTASSGRIFDGNASLVDAFRNAKGYN